MTIFPDSKTLTYSIVESANSDLSSPTTLIAAAIVQAAAGGVGAAGATDRFEPPSDVKAFVGFQIVGSAMIGDGSSLSATLELLT